MRLELLPLQVGDLDAYCNICWEAFSDGVMGLIYPKGFTEGARDWSKDSYLEDIRKHPDQNKMMKVIDHDLPEDDLNGKVVGIGWWKFFPHRRTEDELAAAEKETEERGFPPDCNIPFLEEFHGNVGKYKREIIGGEPYVLLNLLAVLPQYHRRGVGSMHLRWGLEEADKAGLQAYLEASPMGKPLYKKMGYEQVRDFEFDARKWGLDKDLPHVCMLRPAKVTNGQL